MTKFLKRLFENKLMLLLQVFKVISWESFVQVNPYLVF